MIYYKDQYKKTKDKELQSKIDTLDKIITYTTYMIIGIKKNRFFKILYVSKRDKEK